ncbi:(2Fe-2S)-binding protein [Oceanispirochaeta sp.]|jgi:carbon-monoxide dehydrogenase small subunit|uniref:(2Fe-2S)-binding protein n=1 Tax=Oceanispirochaeta sp. TaxID=2035350 RepID=UPI00261956AB|nr:(2Fe-2S)-binding protein [Oceanispirochaeta sp.]MDA3955742.1 (2Fe-2S)-binding protein [Oceanispirochaeta sp.]
MSRITVNGIEHEIGSGMEDQTLLTYLREELDLTGTKNGCSEGTCGACTVLVNYKAVRACRFKMSKAHDAEVLTIEGLIREDGSLHPLQQAFIDAGAVQCGFCTPGMIMQAMDLLHKNPEPDRESIRKAMRGNLCRCTGYQTIIDAVELASKRMMTPHLPYGGS